MKTQQHSRRFGRFLRANEAVSAREYAILEGVIAVGMAAALTAFSGQIEAALAAIGADAIAGANTAEQPDMTL